MNSWRSYTKATAGLYLQPEPAVESRRLGEESRLRLLCVDKTGAASRARLNDLN